MSNQLLHSRSYFDSTMSISHSSGVNFLHTHTHVINRNNPPGVAPWIRPLSVPQLWGTSQFCTSEAVDETFGAIIGLSCPSTLSLTSFVPFTRFHFIRLFWNHTFTYIKTNDMYS